ncbi:MAG: penicillin-binding protein 2 [Verrucomicrobiota bacterium]
MKRIHDPEAVPESFIPRLWLVGVFFAVLLLLLAARLWVVQVQQGEHHSELLSQQNIRRIRLNPVRGRMLAANGKTIMVDTRPSYDLVFHLAEMRQPGPRSNTIAHIAEKAADFGELLGRESPFSEAGLKRHLHVYPALPITVYSDLSKREMALVAEHLPHEPAAEIRPSSRRHYPFPGIATHVFGFAGRRTPSNDNDQYSYIRPELHGRAGLEKQYDDFLTGTPGMQVVRVDTMGFVHEQIGESTSATPGNDLVLTLDHKLQTAADRLLDDHTGAIVVMEIHTGAVLAMASSPTYDLSSLNAKQYSDMALDQKKRPLVNRAANGDYLPGSIIKPLIAMAALENDVVSADETVACPGVIRIGNARIHCWYRAGHGAVDMRGAIEQSCNVYCIDVGMRTGLDRIRPFMLAAGFGRRPAIDLPNAADGLVPSRPWARGHWGRGWLAVDTAYLSIGQGAIDISPLQAAVYTAAIANGGMVYRPFLVRDIRTPDGKLRHRTVPDPEGTLPLSRDNLKIVQEGMKRVVNGANATARRARNPYISLAGKTGTAEVGSSDNRTHNTWFICYGPLDNPRYAAAILIRNGVSGGQTAAPIAKQLFSTWLEPDPDETQ